jgi:hypothetical protein
MVAVVEVNLQEVCEDTVDVCFHRRVASVAHTKPAIHCRSPTTAQHSCCMLDTWDSPSHAAEGGMGEGRFMQGCWYDCWKPKPGTLLVGDAVAGCLQLWLLGCKAGCCDHKVLHVLGPAESYC